MDPEDLALIGAIAGAVGATSGVAALAWNIRSALIADRLHVTFYAYPDLSSSSSNHLHAQVRIANIGTRTVHVAEIKTAKGIGWSRRVPILRSRTTHTRTRWWLRWLIGRDNFVVISDKAIDGRALACTIEPGEVKVEDVDDQFRIKAYLREKRWVVVETGLRTYTARIQDNRTKQR